ncbi:hypothetical protein [Occallatibacter savannae]|uniref:hypothetical protein n=1 Tax=Occallatibacter savannae TaxID=1002691 RepID=UPI000D68B63F|nr:hypothetical protein [Occallatibacter savannae]
MSALAATTILAFGGVLSGLGQQPQAVQSEAAKPAAEKKPAPEVKERIAGNYTMHSSVELGGVITQKDGSSAMWATMVNEGTGMRVLNQSLELRSIDTRKTPFFDRLSTASFGYGGEPNNVSFLNVSKGRWYDFAGNFRRDRNYFDYNLLDNSLLSTATAATPALVPEPSSLHVFNTVRRNTDTLFTLLPLSRLSFRVGYNHNTSEGPTYSTVHEAGDVLVLQWFRNGLDTYTGGVDYKLARRTTLSYDELFALYKGDSSYVLAPTPFTLANGTPTTLGVNTLATTTCGSGAAKTAEVVNGIANPFCTQTLVQSQVAPTRTMFPTEQLRFSSHYWDRVSFNGRVAYSGGVSNVNHFNETFTGLLARTSLRQEIDTGGLENGRLAHNKRNSLNGDFGIEAELTKWFSISDSFDYRYFRTEGNKTLIAQTWANVAATTGGTAPVPPASFNVNTPLSALTNKTTTTADGDTINQKIERNTVLGVFTISPEIKISGGWRFDNRHITDTDENFTWHQNGLVAGVAITPSRTFRANVNLDTLSWKSANSETTANTYTREAPNKVYHVRARAVATPAKWVNFAITGNDFEGKNDDPLVNHKEHNRNFSLATQVIANEQVSFEFNYSHDDVFSQTDLCYAFAPTAAFPLPAGAQGSAGTCLKTPDNPGGTLPTQTAATQLYLGNGTYNAPATFFSGAFTYSPSKYFRFNGGARLTNNTGSAEMLNPLMVPGALNSKVISPFSDLVINIAPQWAWHGNWVHHGYQEAGGPGPAARNFHGDVVTLGVRYAF